MRIISLFPTATEIICALGLERFLVGVSHACTYPSFVNKILRVSSTDFPYEDATSNEINTYVEGKIHNKKSLYLLNESIVCSLRPTHILTQRLCEVCAITPSAIQKVLQKLPDQPEILSLHPHCLSDICKEIILIGKFLGEQHVGKELVRTLETKVNQIKRKTKKLNKKTIFCVEWIDPVYVTGHWIPEMVGIAGGYEILGRHGTPSHKASWKDVYEKNPEIIVFMPCGYSMGKTYMEIQALFNLDFWTHLSAVKAKQVWLVDGPSYFNQSGPRIIQKGIDILSKIIHPSVFGFPTKEEAIHVH